MSRETINRHMREARVIFAMAVTDGYIRDSPGWRGGRACGWRKRSG
jgi:hypothetical protein